MNKLAGLGRLSQPDERDKKYLLPRNAAAKSLTQRYWTAFPAMDQGGTSQCVGYSGYQWLTASPVRNMPKFEPENLYYAAQDVDEWPGTNYEGTSVRALFKVLKARGLVAEYRWAFDAETVIDHLLTRGPVVVGTDWTTGMFMADKEGYIDDIGSASVGGHAYLLIGANRNRKKKNGTKGAVRVLSSWGTKWADGGRAWLSFKALDELIKRNGEACTATEILEPPPVLDVDPPTLTGA